MTTPALAEQAVIGRRIEFAYYSNLQSDSETIWHPGTITAIEPGSTGVTLARLRLDGERRSGLYIPLDYEGLRYLDEVIAVPDLPMGRFVPAAGDFEGAWEGIPVCQLGSEDIVILTGDRDRAEAALTAYCRDQHLDLEYLGAPQARWMVFEWQPEDAECDWVMSFAAEGDDMALPVHYLPA